MLRPNLKGLARTLIIGAEFDPLVDDNEAYALRLPQAGVPTQYACFKGMHHPFLHWAPASMTQRRRKI